MISNIDYATDLVLRVCSLTNSENYLSDLRRTMHRNGVVRAVRHHDSAKLVAWLVEAVSYQGISDAMATRYMAEHGRVSIRQVEADLAHDPTCPHLWSFEQFPGCGYRKGARTCARPDLIESCPLPRHDLRNGRLNQIAYALALFVRDVCGGNLVGWIDDQLAAADDPEADDPTVLMRGALLEPLARVPGLSYKVLSMSLADLLQGAGDDRARWADAGAGMVAIDTLVHNWLARTGILRRFNAEHAYGAVCYAPGRCAALITSFAEATDTYAHSPRLLQHAIWKFCAGNGLGICNGDRIDDRLPCTQDHCPLSAACDRLPLSLVRYRVGSVGR